MRQRPGNAWLCHYAHFSQFDTYRLVHGFPRLDSRNGSNEPEAAGEDSARLEPGHPVGRGTTTLRTRALRNRTTTSRATATRTRVSFGELSARPAPRRGAERQGPNPMLTTTGLCQVLTRSSSGARLQRSYQRAVAPGPAAALSKGGRRAIFLQDGVMAIAKRSPTYTLSPLGVRGMGVVPIVLGLSLPWIWLWTYRPTTSAVVRLGAHCDQR